jgi:hypothetical protein
VDRAVIIDCKFAINSTSNPAIQTETKGSTISHTQKLTLQVEPSRENKQDQMVSIPHQLCMQHPKAKSQPAI